MEFVGCLKACVDERKGENANGEWRLRSYLLEEVATFNARKIVVDVMDGEVGRFAKWDELLGKNVVIQFDINATKYTGKDGSERWFNNVRAWQIKSTEPEPPKENNESII